MQPEWQDLIDQTLQDDFLRDAYSWEPLAKGSSNTIFFGRLKTSDPTVLGQHSQLLTLNSTVVLRLNAHEADTPGVSRSREASILNRIQPYHWAPQIIKNSPELGWCLMHHYQTIPLNIEDQSLPSPYETQLLAAVDELQAIPIPAGDELISDYRALLNDTYIPIAEQRNDEQAHRWVQTIKNNLASLPAVPTCLVHHDLHLGNFAATTEITNTEYQLIILDWEYAAIGNPWFDASCLSRYLSISADKIHQLRRFHSIDAITFEAALKQANEMTETLEMLWYWAREKS